MNHTILTTKNRIKNTIKFSLIILFLSIIGIWTSPILAGDTPKTETSATKSAANGFSNGKKLHDAKCFGCHDTRQYTRKNRIVHTYEDLHARVEFCDAASNAGFSFDDLDDVVTYLNTEFYKFKQ